MGVDLSGWVEIRDHRWGEWHGVIRIDSLVHRSYGMFASLFGLRNYGRFRPTAEGRGVPDDWSSEFHAEWRDGRGNVGTTWVLWSEIATIDWDEEEQEKEKDEEDEQEESGQSTTPSPIPLVHPTINKHHRRDYLRGGWVTLFKMMELLAADYGADGVRLSVWFDSR
jgi:hypothetical protein